MSAVSETTRLHYFMALINRHPWNVILISSTLNNPPRVISTITISRFPSENTSTVPFTCTNSGIHCVLGKEIFFTSKLILTQCPWAGEIYQKRKMSRFISTLAEHTFAFMNNVIILLLLRKSDGLFYEYNMWGSKCEVRREGLS